MATLRTLVSSGASSNRVDIVFLGDGYTAAEIATTYTQHVQNYIAYLFGGTASTEPFNQYQNFFNVHVIDVISAQSGADDQGRGIVRDTALNARYYFDGVTERLLYIDVSLAAAQVAATLPGTGITVDMGYVTVNETVYGGGGGSWGVFAGGNGASSEVALHEIGHSFAKLADEYTGNPGVYLGAEPIEPNVTKDSTGAKWAPWLGYVDPLLGTVGAYQGGRYYDQGIYRPTLTSKMKALGNPFDPIAREAFIHQFYSFVDPLDGFDNNVGAKTNLQNLRVDVIDPAVIRVDWTVNGQLFTNMGETFSLRENNFGWGAFTVTARAYDPTPWVRGSRTDLEQSVSWTVTNDYRRVGGTEDDQLDGNANDQELVGLGGNDILKGFAGFDSLIGGGGHDTLDGGANPETKDGNGRVTGGQGDIMLGGEGDDTYLVDSPLDFIDEGYVFTGAGFGGVDTVRSTSDFFWDVYGIGDKLIIEENAVDVGNDGTTIVGGVFSNELIGNSKTNIMFGRGGSDTYRAGDGVDFISLSLLGVPDNLYVGVNGPNVVFVDPRAGGPFSYDIVFEFEPGKDKINLSAYNYTHADQVFARGFDDGAGSSYFALGDGLDYLYMVGLTKAQIQAGDFIL